MSDIYTPSMGPGLSCELFDMLLSTACYVSRMYDSTVICSSQVSKASNHHILVGVIDMLDRQMSLDY